MKHFILLSPFLFLISEVFCQRSIKGTVTISGTEEIIAGASVFVSNSSKGTVSDRNGRFELNDVPSGKQDLIISSVGYETYAYTYTTEQLPLTVKVELKQKVRELANVTIEPSEEQGWDRWGKTFRDNFIGQTPNARSCVIKNEKAIRFRYFRKSNRVIAYADEPVIIENRALGYVVKFQLEDFEVNFKENSTMFAGYPFFEEIDKDRASIKKKWERNREKAFNGSMMQFMRSIYQNRLGEDGFEVRRMAKVPNHEKERVKLLYPSGSRPDSAEYYQRILRQKDVLEIYSPRTLTADSLIVGEDGEYKILFFKDYLYVTYKKELEDKEYLAYHMDNSRPTFQRSYIWLTQEQPVTIDIHGSYTPVQEVFAMSYWGWGEKIANTLPLEYELPAPEK